MNNLLIPLDFSENSEKVIAAAKLIAGKSPTKFILLHAYQPAVPDMTVPSGVGMTTLGSDLGLEEHFRKRLNEMAEKLETEGYGTEALWSFGGIHPAVMKAIKKHRPAMVILGRSGEGGFMDRLLGSSATGIGLDADCPVLIVPSQATLSPFREVVYATQLEYDENQVLDRALPMLRSFGARVTFLKIDSRTQPDILADDQLRQQIMDHHAISAENFVTLKANSVLGGIEAYCREIKADLLVMATRKRGFFEAFITNPSLTKKMIVETHLPLLVYHLAEK